MVLTRPTILAIYLAAATRLPMKAVPLAEAKTGGGLSGDRYEGAKHRHLSLFTTGELAAASEHFGQTIDPALTRRNILLDAGVLPRSPGHRMSVGSLVVEVVRDAAPCRMLDMEIGDGARTAMRRRAGVICRVLRGGTIAVGDEADLMLEGLPTS